MTKTVLSLLILTAIATAGDVAKELKIYHETFVAKGHPDPAKELRAALRSSYTAWKSDVAYAREAAKQANKPRAVLSSLDHILLNRIVPPLRKIAGPRFAKLKIAVLRLNHYEAHTWGGDRIYISDTLLRKLNKNELAAVLAHEISHVVARHTYRKRLLSRRLKGSAIQKAMAMRLYSRICEAEADAMATVILRRAGFDARVTTQFDILAAAHPKASKLRFGLMVDRAFVEACEYKQDRLEAEYERGPTSRLYKELNKVKFLLSAARTRLKKSQGQHAFLRLASERTHPDIKQRKRRNAIAWRRDGSDALVSYVLRACKEPLR